KLKEFTQAVIKRSLEDIAKEFEKIAEDTKHAPAAKNAFDANTAKNRYKNICCGERTRVVLDDKFVASRGDYIHANRVWSLGGEDRFICAQGPLDGTVDDLWRLVWQEETTGIVMLCDLVEGRKQKCAQYWPADVGESITTESGFTIKTLEVQQEEQTLCKTTLKLTLRAKSMTVVHWHWQRWPDHGVPAANLLAIRLLDQIENDEKVVVHCSADLAGRAEPSSEPSYVLRAHGSELGSGGSSLARSSAR
ncbi:Protein T27A3.5, partial [Aphelenchoides avenae]